ncbi:MAG: transglutaminase protein [Frankiales bacterium]|jgi:transglutaminase-like putative cysteine protease|nr:transglutaminase protein [Frankiales bacterium]
MRLRVRHGTGYRYDTEVLSSYNEARLVPQTGLTQLTLSSEVTTHPQAQQQRYWDYWGTQVTVFDVHVPHTELQVTCTSVVDTTEAPPAGDVTWEQLEAAGDTQVELMRPSVKTTPNDDLKALAAEAKGSPRDVVLALSGLVKDRVAYVPGSTGVQTSAVDAWELGQGVCQDIAHVTLSLLREAGVPARYVSGYLHPTKEPAIGETVLGESHAWVEAWLGSWWGFDPTNGIPAGERHVVVARARDYNDLPPLKGVYAGGGMQSLGVTVEVTRLA